MFISDDDEKRFIKESQIWRNKLNIQIIFPEDFIEKVKKYQIYNNDIPQVSDYRIVGLVDPNRSNLFEGCHIKEGIYERCLLRVYLPHEWKFFSNEIFTYDRIKAEYEKLKNRYQDLEKHYQKMQSILFIEQSQALMIVLDYHFIMNFVDFKYGLSILPSDAKLKIILKIAKGLLSFLDFFHNGLELAHCNISAETIIFNLDMPPVVTDFSHVLDISKSSIKKKLIHRDLMNVGLIIQEFFLDEEKKGNKHIEIIEDKVEQQNGKDPISLNEFFSAEKKDQEKKKLEEEKGKKDYDENNIDPRIRNDWKRIKVIKEQLLSEDDIHSIDKWYKTD